MVEEDEEESEDDEANGDSMNNSIVSGEVSNSPGKKKKKKTKKRKSIARNKNDSALSSASSAEVTFKNNANLGFDKTKPNAKLAKTGQATTKKLDGALKGEKVKAKPNNLLASESKIIKEAFVEETYSNKSGDE